MRAEQGLEHDLPRSWSLLGLAVILILQAGMTVLWLQIDTRPPAWDRAIHAELAFRCGEILASPSSDLPRRISSMSGFYPPLVHCVAGLAYLFAPVSKFTLQAVIYLFLASSLVATYLLGAAMHSRAVGLAAAGMVVAGPFIQVESRWFMLDIPLMAFVAISYLAALKSDGFTRFGPSLAAGVIMGLGSLAKWSLLIYTSPAFLVAFFSRWQGKKKTKSLVLAGMAAMVALAIAGFWYLPRIMSVTSALVGRAFRGGELQGDPPVFSAGSAFYYIAGLLPQVGVIAAALFLLGLAALLGKGSAGIALAVSWAVPWGIFALLRNKGLRYTLPLIPAVALVASYGLSRLRAPARRVAVTVLVVGSLWQVLASGFGVLSVGDVRIFLGLPLVPADPPRREYWPISQVLGVIAADSGGRPVSVAIVPDYPEFSRSNLRYAATLKHLPYRFGLAWDETPVGFEYIVLKTGDQGPEFTTAKARRIMGAISKGDGSFTKAFRAIGRFPLPTGDEAIVLRRDIQPVEATAAEVLERLKANSDKFMRGYVRKLDGLQVKVTSEGESLRAGRAERLEVFARRAEVGDFQRKPAGIALSNVWVELRGVIFNPHALMDEGRFELLDLELVNIHRASLTEEAARAYIQSDPKLEGIEVFLEDGVIRLELRRRLLRASARFSARSSDGYPDVNVLETSLWGVRVPPRILKSVIGGVDPEQALRRFRVEIRIGEVSIRDRRIEVGAADSPPSPGQPAS